MAKILIVDDDSGVRLTLQLMLEEARHEIIVAENGEEGMEKYREHKNNIDLVISDMLMPGLDGSEFILRLSMERQPVPVLAISGGNRVLSPEDSLIGAEGFCSMALKKPFNKEELLGAVNQLLKTKK